MIMIRTRGRKILRDIWARKARTALVAVSIFIGVFGTITLFTMGDLSVRKMKEDLDEDRLAMIRSYVSVPPGVQPDNEQVLATLRALPDVTTVEGQISALFWNASGAEMFESSYLFCFSEPLDQVQLEPARLTGGRWPEPGQKEIVVERRFADERGLGVDDQIVVRALSQADESGGAAPEETWTIVGTAFQPYGYNSFSPVLPEDTLFAALDDAQYLTGLTGFSSFYVRYTDYPTADVHSEEFSETIAASGDYIPVFTYKEDPAKNSLIAFLETSAGVMSILGLLALIVSGFLVFNVLTAIVSEQRRQIGVMKSVGATGWTIS
jgi:putative ABC transport system permease protein